MPIHDMPDGDLKENIESGMAELARRIAVARRANDMEKVNELSKQFRALADFAEDMMRQARENANLDTVMDVIKEQFRNQNSKAGEVITGQWLLMLPSGLKGKVNPKQYESLNKAIECLVHDGWVEVTHLMGLPSLRLTQKGYDRLY